MKGSRQGRGLLAFYLARDFFSIKDEIYFGSQKSPVWIFTAVLLIRLFFPVDLYLKLTQL